MAALDAKSPYTAGHSKSVSDMVEILCRLLGLNRMMHIASHLHDIGKIGRYINRRWDCYVTEDDFFK